MSSFFNDVVPETSKLRFAELNGDGVGAGRVGVEFGDGPGWGTLYVLECRVPKGETSEGVLPPEVLGRDPGAVDSR